MTGPSIRLLILLGMAAGCRGGQVAHCELEVNHTAICVESAASYAHCRDEWGGLPTLPKSSDVATCQDLGYRVYCDGQMIETDRTSQSSYAAGSKEECDAAEGGRL
jgi:hypothetical protein